MASFWKENQLVWTKKNSSWIGEPKCKVRSEVAHFFVFRALFHCLKKKVCCSNFVRMEDMLWIEDIVDNTSIPPFLVYYRVDMVDFVNIHKVVARKNAFSAFPSV
jgi:hypothetical protein